MRRAPRASNKLQQAKRWVSLVWREILPQNGRRLILPYEVSMNLRHRKSKGDIRSNWKSGCFRRHGFIMSWDRRLYFLDERRPFGFLSFCFVFIFSENLNQTLLRINSKIHFRTKIFFFSPVSLLCYLTQIICTPAGPWTYGTLDINVRKYQVRVNIQSQL